MSISALNENLSCDTDGSLLAPLQKLNASKNSRIQRMSLTSLLRRFKPLTRPARNYTSESTWAMSLEGNYVLSMY